MRLISTKLSMIKSHKYPFLNRNDFQIKISVHFEDWAIMNAPSTILHQFQTYTYDSEKNDYKIINETMKYQYTYEFKNVSFSQGNTGYVQYLNEWKRTFLPNQNQSNQQYNLFNIDA